MKLLCGFSSTISPKSIQIAREAIQRPFRIFTFAIEENEFVVVVGPSGCGKSTLLNIIAGLLSPSSGQVIIEGARTDSKPDTAIVFQEFALFPWRTVLKNIVYGLEEQGLKKQNS